jgi:hypothetical protein
MRHLPQVELIPGPTSTISGWDGSSWKVAAITSAGVKRSTHFSCFPSGGVGGVPGDPA